jgi:hypothetical protein
MSPRRPREAGPPPLARGLAAESLRRPWHEQHKLTGGAHIIGLLARTTSKGTQPAVAKDLDGNEVRWGTSKDKVDRRYPDRPDRAIRCPERPSVHRLNG